MNSSDGRDAFNEPLRLGKHIQIDLGGAAKKRFSDFASSTEAFLHAVRILLIGYALVSAADPVPWCSLGAAQRYINCVESVSRISAKSNHIFHRKLLDAEMNARSEWTRIAQAEPNLSLVDIIEIIANKHTIWPVAADLKGTKGAGWPNKRSATNPYAHNPYDNPPTNQWKDRWGESSKDLVT